MRTSAPLGTVHLGVGPPSGARRRRRRRRVGAVATLATVALTAGWFGATAGADSRGSDAGRGVGSDDPGGLVASDAVPPAVPSGTAAAPAEDRPADPAPVAAHPRADEDVDTPPLARLGELSLHLPAERAVVVGYHEAATVAAFGLTPVGTVTEDRNTTRTDLPGDDAAGTPYLVLSSRGRSAGPTSAIDVVLEPDVAVLAPVSGTVLDVRTYLLYGAHEDLRIELVPDGHPELRVVLIHLDGGRVEVGERVTAGVTALAATARSLPFGSHIDRETEPDRFPHVHLEVQAIDAVRPGDDPAAAEDVAGPPAR